MNQTYLDTARLLTQVAPLVFLDDTFALKGGTAINLFIRGMPRLSVDLDLVLPDYNLSRERALERINTGIRCDRSSVTASMPTLGGSSALRPAKDRMMSSVSLAIQKWYALARDPTYFAVVN